MSLHINTTKNKIAKTVLLPGDPKRAEFIAKEFLTGAKEYSDVRYMKGFTGTYKDKKISVQTTGMGCPSMGIIAAELINEFKVKNLIRVGSCGSFSNEVNLGDIIVASGAATDSNYAHTFNINATLSAIPNFDLLKGIVDILEKREANFKVGEIITCDVFYEYGKDWWKQYKDLGILGVEMETFALYVEAMKNNVNALALFTASDHFLTSKKLSVKERETSFTNMINSTLDLGIKLK